MKRVFVIVLTVLLAASAARAEMTYKPGQGFAGPKTPEPADFRTDRGDYEQALSVYQSGDGLAALKLCDDLIATYPSGPWVERAMLLKARAYYHLGDLSRSETQLNLLQKQFPATALGGEIGDLRLAIANTRLGAGKASGVKSLETMVETNPYGARSDEAQFLIAQHYFDQKQYADAVDALTLLLTHYPDSRYHEEALFLRAKASYLSNTGPQRDSQPYEEARATLEQYLREFPGGRYAKEAEGMMMRAENALAQKLFLVGEFYVKQKHERAAERYFEAVVMRYPKNPWAKRARAKLPIGWEPPPKPAATPAATPEEAPPADAGETAPSSDRTPAPTEVPNAPN